MIPPNVFCSILLLVVTIHSGNSEIHAIDDCDLLIAGGSTAALGAIVSASTFLNTRVCLFEPTDWVGGQLTAELLSAPDFVYHSIKDKDNFTLNVGSIDRQMDNRNPLFKQMLDALEDIRHCTVSPYCSILSLFHSQVVLPVVKNTHIFYNTVLKRVHKDPSGFRIIQVHAI